MRDECDLLDSIYLPSKYPLGSALPNFVPGTELCERCVSIVRRVCDSAADLLSES
jgi:hypothetical protein